MKRIVSFTLAVITLLSAVSCSSDSDKSSRSPNTSANVVTDKSRIFKRSELPFPDKLNIITDILKDSYLEPIAREMTEITPTISGQELYSIPFEEKLRRLDKMRDICSEYGIQICVCGCKDERYKQTELEWICHPYNRQKRIELAEDSNVILEYDHLGKE